MNATLTPNYNTTGSQRDTWGTSSGADFPTDPTGQGNVGGPGGTNAFVAGFDEFIKAPGAFLTDLFGGNGGYVPKTQPSVGDSISTFGQDFFDTPGKLVDSVAGATPTWIKVAIFGGIAVVGLIAVHSILKDV